MSKVAVTPDIASLIGVDKANGAGLSKGDAVRGRLLPVREELATVLPWAGLRSGSTVALPAPGELGARALLLALLTEATTAGSWAAVTGVPGLGLLAAAELGVAVHRLALVPKPGGQTAAVAAALLDGFDLVVIAGECLPADQRRLSARARNRGAVLLPMGGWPGADVTLRCTGDRWTGVGYGEGRLRTRHLTVTSDGRRAAARPRTTTLTLPTQPAPLAPVRHLERVS
ncbi:hypothetical protein D5S17_11180 [Pseudonocardiaceae bacterium YIM PH 21723]|nr:hypothetical protein D5S17_11180 [Pseudonocardiaceae bacterium YIM PH 21723]